MLYACFVSVIYARNLRDLPYFYEPKDFGSSLLIKLILRYLYDCLLEFLFCIHKMIWFIFTISRRTADCYKLDVVIADFLKQFLFQIYQVLAMDCL